MDGDEIKLGQYPLSVRYKAALDTGRGVALTQAECREFMRLRDASPALLEACKLLAGLFPEEIDQMDAADFVDRATQIMGCVIKAKAAIAAAEKGD